MRTRPFVIGAKAIALGILFLMIAADSNATVSITDRFSVSGFLRYEFGVHTGQRNPNLPENHDLTLSKFFLQTEWTYRPSDTFKLFANIRILGDTTYHWDSNLDRYNAFPIDVPKDDWTMMKASEDDFRAEVWELYADVTLGNLWLRLGKQQIAWGEMIAARFLDAINPLDYSWNFIFEPEEFEILRIPNWSIRGIYTVEQQMFPLFQNVNIEAFLNPGDVLPNQYASPGAPFTLAPAFPPFMKINEKENRGKVEYGVRVGAMMGPVYGTLNYLHLYSDDFNLQFRGLNINPSRPFVQLVLSAEFKSIDLYGISLNYAWEAPNIVISFEGVWTPDQPYADAGRPFAIRDQGTWKYALLLTRPTKVLPSKFLHASFMMIQLQFAQTIVEGNEDKVFGTGNSKLDKTVNQIVCFLQQPLLYNNITLGLQMVFDPDDGYFVKPFVKYVYGDHWYFDVFATFLGGSEKRPGRLGSLYWADSVYGRITFQF